MVTLIDAYPPKFTLDTARVLNLFTGDRFYSSADAAIREAVLNAIDACGRRGESEPTCEPQIQVSFDEDALTVMVSDNGDGMGKGELAELFSKVGASASNLAAKNAAEQYKAVGEFGIGVISYYLVCDKYRVHTKKGNDDPLGLEFTRTMLDGETAATDIPPERTTQGTTLILFVKTLDLLRSLIAKFPHWIRNVHGLSATIMPSGLPLRQGGLGREIRTVQVELPTWAERANIGPPYLFDAWDHFDGSAHVDVLYRGVFVDHLDVPRLWATEGSIDVNPKDFKPKLNREGFVGDTLRGEVTQFLQAMHPNILVHALDCMREVLDTPNAKEWTLRRWVTLWLAIPRDTSYANAAKAWDEEFRNREAFLLLETDGERGVSVADLELMKDSVIYIAPTNLEQQTDWVKQAVRILRARGLRVVQGILRDDGYLHLANLLGPSTDPLLQHFRGILPRLERVEKIAEHLVRADSVAELFEANPRVRLVPLGGKGAPLVRVGNEIWINVESSPGKEIVREVCDRNDGYFGFLAACLMHAPGAFADLANILRDAVGVSLKLGLVRRQFLRGLVK